MGVMGEDEHDRYFELLGIVATHPSESDDPYVPAWIGPNGELEEPRHASLN